MSRAVGFKHSAETRMKMSASMIGKNIGKVRSSEQRAVLRAANIGKQLSSKHRAKIGGALCGRPKSSEHRQKLSAAARRQFERDPVPVLEALAKGRLVQGPTRLERALGHLLSESGLEFETQHRFGVYHVDAYVPSHNLVFEADGEWGHNSNRDRVRDAYLVRGGVAAVIRLVRADLQPWMVAA